MELKKNFPRPCHIGHLEKRDVSDTCDQKHRRLLHFTDPGGNDWSFYLFRTGQAFGSTWYRFDATLYKFSAADLLDFEIYDFFDHKNTIILGADDEIIEVDRYHLIIRFDRLNRWVKAYDSYHGIEDWDTLSPEDKAKHRPIHYEISLQKVLNELIGVCKLDSSCIQLDRARRELHVTFEL